MTHYHMLKKISSLFFLKTTKKFYLSHYLNIRTVKRARFLNFCCHVMITSRSDYGDHHRDDVDTTYVTSLMSSRWWSRDHHSRRDLSILIYLIYQKLCNQKSKKSSIALVPNHVWSSRYQIEYEICRKLRKKVNISSSKNGINRFKLEKCFKNLLIWWWGN